MRIILAGSTNVQQYRSSASIGQLMRFVNLEDYPLGRLAAMKQELRKQSS